ncbi:MAG TPA: ATP-binding protein [Aggregatilineales bacterium]|nr:ATP-binding protein [Anaerolineales bacterium]HRE47474.1 ATP-binding protein [Aggregatilineales bacterium]
MAKKVENEKSTLQKLRYEVLVDWAATEWERLYPGAPFMALWASDNCGNNRARERVQPGRKLRGKVRYTGIETLNCPHVVPISDYRLPGPRPLLDESVGAWHFQFTGDGGACFGAIYVSSYYEDGDKCMVSVALIPPDRVDPWVQFEVLCNQAARHLERSQRVYIIGGENGSFKPTVEWDQVILPESIKADLRAEMETFFNEGVDIYKQLNLAPFRKLLLVGPPGTGKTTLCAALAKLALNQKRVVVYVSGADDDGASFRKIHHALNVVSEARFPVLLIVEEIDVYLRKEDKAQILNVLDGLESPNNPRGALLIATTNYPEVIDERIAKRPGRVDRIIHIPTIQDGDQAARMLQRYMATQWSEDHRAVVDDLIGQTGAFVREVALYARMLAAHNRETIVSVNILRQSVNSLSSQLATGYDLRPKREMGFGATAASGRRRNGTDGN